MESAIDKHLQCPRTLSRRVHDGYQPPFPMFVGRASDDLTQVVMAYLGVQFREEDRENAVRAMQHIVSTFSLSNGPGNHDISFHTDNQGYGNFIVVGYWRDRLRTVAGSVSRRSKTGGLQMSVCRMASVISAKLSPAGRTV